MNGPGLADLSIVGDGNGGVTLQQIQDECSTLCEELDMKLEFRQTDDQDEMARWIADDSDNFDALVINPMGRAKSASVDSDKYRSAIKTLAHLNKPVIEVHLTNIFREDDVSIKPLQGPEGDTAFICGMGKHSYLLGVKAAARRLESFAP